MRAWQTLPATWWAGLTWKDTAPTLSAQPVKLFNARTVRWCYGGPEAIGKDMGHPRDKNMALDAFWPEPETITLKMLWALKGCSICEIEIETETNKKNPAGLALRKKSCQIRCLNSPSRVKVKQIHFHSKVWENFLLTDVSWEKYETMYMSEKKTDPKHMEEDVRSINEQRNWFKKKLETKQE